MLLFDYFPQVLTDCPRQCSCEACEYSKSNPTDFGKVSLLVYGEGGSPVKAVNNESQAFSYFS